MFPFFLLIIATNEQVSISNMASSEFFLKVKVFILSRFKTIISKHAQIDIIRNPSTILQNETKHEFDYMLKPLYNTKNEIERVCQFIKEEFPDIIHEFIKQRPFTQIRLPVNVVFSELNNGKFLNANITFNVTPVI